MSTTLYQPLLKPARPWYMLHVFAWIMFLVGHPAIAALMGIDYQMQYRAGHYGHSGEGLYMILDALVIVISVALLVAGVIRADRARWFAILMVLLYVPLGVVAWFLLGMYAYFGVGGPGP